MQIIREELQPLNDPEKATLKRIRDKKLYFFLGAFITLLLVLPAAYYYGLAEAKNGSSRGMIERYGSEENAERFRRIAPYMIAIYFICLIAFFTRYYLRSVKPFVTDFKKCMKRVVHFYPESYKTPYFNHFYLVTGSKKRPMLRISTEMYHAIQPGVTGDVCMLPTSRFILSMKVGNKTMEFNEKNTILDL